MLALFELGNLTNQLHPLLEQLHELAVQQVNLLAKSV